MEHTPTPWEREYAQDGEYTGPGDNPPGYIGEMYETNHVGWRNRETGEWIPVADFYRETDCVQALRAVNAHEGLVEACKAQKRLIEDMMRFVGQMALKDYRLLNEAPIMADAALKKAGTL